VAAYIGSVLFCAVDLNDTVKDSEYYKEFTERWNGASEEEKVALRDEKDALDKAEKHYNTPTIEHLDSLGRKFLQIEILNNNEQSNLELKPHVKLVIQGDELESVGSRFYEQNQDKQENEKVKNFVHVYSMTTHTQSLVHSLVNKNDDVIKMDGTNVKKKLNTIY
jgi:hypothetical protein